MASYVPNSFIEQVTPIVLTASIVTVTITRAASIQMQQPTNERKTLLAPVDIVLVVTVVDMNVWILTDDLFVFLKTSF